MRLIASLFLITLFTQLCLTDDYFLSEEEDQVINEEADQGDFMRQFTCLVATQRYVNARSDQIMKLEQAPLYQTNFKRLKSRLFTKCMKEVNQDIVNAVQRATSAKEFELIDWGVTEEFDFKEVFAEQDARLNSEDLANYKAFLAVEEKVREIQKKSKRDNPDKEDEAEEEETWDQIRKSKEPPSIAGVSLNNRTVIGVVLAAFSVLVFVIYKLSNSLFAEKQKGKKKDRKKN